mmetsp:Transcript_1267/g.1886  ORF Transcript_1267/g.1886 Transcript_1267/m.1886 type:complete len:86 (-) Transcript_1267:1309-1566(-)
MVTFRFADKRAELGDATGKTVMFLDALDVLSSDAGAFGNGSNFTWDVMVFLTRLLNALDDDVLPPPPLPPPPPPIVDPIAAAETS